MTKLYDSAALFILLSLAMPGLAQPDAASRAIDYRATPAWVVAPPAPSAAPTQPGAPLRVVYFDQQVRSERDRDEIYQTYRMRLLSPEALAAGNIALSWSPANQRVAIHELRIVRAAASIDVLKSQKFAILQRENNLEKQMLDGTLTATLQVAGLQVGDELVFATTQTNRTLHAGERPAGFMQFPQAGARGAYRLRVVHPGDARFAFRASSDVPPPAVKTTTLGTEHYFDLRDPASAIVPEGAPPRFGVTRIVQFSAYGDWSAVAQFLTPLFTRAAILSPSSPIKAEAARIAAATADPIKRAEAALRLVQEQVRYVYVGLDGGNYRPASVEETWQRRFGDCKAKTALLVAVLGELGIAAEPVLVDVNGGDGIDERLPTPAVFNHIVVRTTIAGVAYWLDGTRAGDRSLASIEPPRARWVLPLRAGAVELEALSPVAARRPELVEAVEIDATRGFDQPGNYRVQRTLRTEEIFGMRAYLAGLVAADADRTLVAYWRRDWAEIEATRTSWRFDDANRLLVLTLEGTGKVDWEGDAKQGRTHYLIAGGFNPPAELKRPKDQAQDAPWLTDFPSYVCRATTVRLPPTGKGFRWSFSSAPMDRVLGGVAYWRKAALSEGVMRLIRSRRVLVPELSAAEATSLNAAIAGFDNNKSWIFEQTDKAARPAAPVAIRAAFPSFDDLAGANPVCTGSARLSGFSQPGSSDAG